MPHLQPDPKRRQEDRPFARWKNWSLWCVVFGSGYLSHSIATALFSDKIQQFGISVMGGITFAGIIYGATAQQVFSNLKELASSEKEVNEKLETKLEEVEKRYKQEMADLKESYESRMKAQEKHYDDKINQLISQVTTYQAQNEAKIIENITLQGLLTKVLAENKARELRTRKSHILLVDDEESIREALRYVLTGAGFEVVAVQDAVSALHILEEDQDSDIDLVISDFAMPNLDGEEMLKIFRTMGGKTKWMIYTGHAPEMTDGFSKTYNVPVLVKPVDNAELVRKVKEILAQ